jgi:hypothetical protein
MKPVHHALVSSRLFGGHWTGYEPLHTAFDRSKMALGDMRHRAALHSVDHGGQVMAMLFKDKVWEGTTLEALVAQHVDDDQGFPTHLHHWLDACSVPAGLGNTRRSNPLAAFLVAPEEACAAKWGGQPEDYAAVCAYFALPETCCDHPLAPAVSRNTFGVFFAEHVFGPALTVQHRGQDRLVCVRDIGEDLTIARYGRLPTLGEVFAQMRKEDWMFGARVSASRTARCKAAGRPDLFDTQMDAMAD